MNAGTLDNSQAANGILTLPIVLLGFSLSVHRRPGRRHGLHPEDS